MAVTFDPCLCSLVTMLSPVGRDQVTALITSLVGLLQGLKATILLFAIDIDDNLRRLKYEAELTIMQQALDAVQAPFSMLAGYLKLLSDCSPVASFAQTLKDTRDDLLGDLEERTYELEQLISAIADKQKKIEVIDKRIEMLEEIRDALDACG